MALDIDTLIALTGWIGAHAWPLFCAALLALILTVGAGAHVLRRPLRALSAQREPRPLLLLAGLAMGFAGVLGLAELFADIAEGLGDGHPMGRMDDALSRAIGQHTPPPVLQAFAWLTHLGDPAWLTLVCIAVAAALWLRRHRILALGWLLAVAGNALLNTTLKQVFARARPFHEDGLVAASGYSFPSGHTSGTVVAYGMLAYLACNLLPPRWHVPAIAAAAAIAFTTACSRVFLRVHYATDVLAGLCSGLAWLAVCIGSVAWARHRQHARSAGAGERRP